ncbi:MULTISPECIES: DNA alkylation repair protein [Bacteroides]|jgi:3-methyladenine DNA glycosylase AlkD|uniref:DNA alkylation repair protein n=1 Tax=Bacteroides uniformis TaxID=820 RepID=A0A3E4R7U1_BACUN|nr:DNA alkylation repair protein [Bacteroides uniformis]RGL16323.1 DNA alkylation repair protein [Bacteroides uniformis]
MNEYIQIENELRSLSDPQKQIDLPRFFKTSPGEYGEGDKFLGVVVPNIREVAKRHKDAPIELLAELMQSEWHEVRMCALAIMVQQVKKKDDAKRKAMLEFYLTQTTRMNNWDLVDLSAPAVVGEYLHNHPEEHNLLYRLAESPLLWDNRIAVVANWTLIKYGEFENILKLAAYYINKEEKLHDLMQKAIGWMLREVGKRDEATLVSFLNDYAKRMPRTTLRYAIEKFSPERRKEFMKR